MSIRRSINEFIYRRRNSSVVKLQPQVDRGFASHGQDVFIAESLLPHVSRGVFVEVGANDGVSLSNTCFFERELQWSGIAVEPLPRAYGQLINNRTCRSVQGCVSDSDGEAQFLEITGDCEMLSGLVGKYDAQHRRRIRRNLRRHQGATRQITVPCFTLESLLVRHGIDHVNYLSVDTEGGEIDILKSIDFAKYPIDVVSAENNYFDAALASFMQDQGYALVAIAGVDEIYCRRSVARQAA